MVVFTSVQIPEIIVIAASEIAFKRHASSVSVNARNSRIIAFLFSVRYAERFFSLAVTACSYRERVYDLFMPVVSVVRLSLFSDIVVARSCFYLFPVNSVYLYIKLLAHDSRAELVTRVPVLTVAAVDLIERYIIYLELQRSLLTVAFRVYIYIDIISKDSYIL